MTATHSPRRSTLWVVSELFHPDETSTSHYLSQLAFGLSDTGPVKAISTRTKGTPLAAHEVHRGIEIFRCSVPSLDKNRLGPRLAKALLSTASMLGLCLFKIRRGDTVMAVTNPPTLPMFLVPLMKLKGVRTVLRIDDVYPDSAVAAGILDASSLLYRCVLGANRFLYRFADSIITLGRDMADVVSRRMSRDEDKVKVIPNFADLDEIRPLPKQGNPILQQLGIEDRFVVLIAGNIGRVQGIPALVEAASLLANEPIAFLFVGGGALEGFVRKQISEKNLTNVFLWPNQPRSKQSEFLSACDVALLTLAENMYGIGVPSRLYNYMAAERPVVGVVDANSEPGLVIREEEIGWVAKPGNAHSIAQAVRTAKQSTELEAMGKKARRIALRDYSSEAVVAAYARLMSELERLGFRAPRPLLPASSRPE